ncbi:MAG TPA: ABC transporter, partial [Acidimicrobiales bacterium]|nr:ABC transporter [Acidimicrobiales bacterium]
MGSRRAFRVVERNARTYVRMWPAFLSGFLEPVFYLFSIGIGVGALVGDLPGPGGRPVAYDVFVAPAMLATSAMNGTVFDTTFNFFFKFKYAKTFDGMLATPLGVRDIVRGEVTWALLRAL